MPRCPECRATGVARTQLVFLMGAWLMAACAEQASQGDVSSDDGESENVNAAREEESGNSAEGAEVPRGDSDERGATTPSSGEPSAQPAAEFPTGAAGPGADLPAICHEFADAVCERKAECGALRNDYGQEYGECRWRMLTSCASNWNVPGANFGEAGLTQCLADLDGYDCYALLHLYGIGIPASVQGCDPPGTQLDGEPCELRFQCVGEVCALDDTTGCQQCLSLNDDNADAWALSGADYGHVENAGDPPSHEDCTNSWLELVNGTCQPFEGLDTSPRDEPEPSVEPADRSVAGLTCSYESDCAPSGFCSGASVNELTGMQAPGTCTLTLALGEACVEDTPYVSCVAYAECIDGLCQLPVITLRDYDPLPESCTAEP